MAVYILRPGPLSLFSGSGAVVGDPPQWADDSDATYGRVDNTNTSGGSGRVHATLEPLPSTVTDISSATLHCRVMLANAGAASGSSFMLSMPGTPDVCLWVTYPGFGDGVNYLPGTGVIYDYATSGIETSFGDLVTLSDLLPYFQAGMQIELFRGGFGGSSYEYHATVYELWVEIEAGAAPAVYGIPPLRQLQRGDGLGMSGAPRAVQNRSQQASLRQIGFQ